MLVRLLLVAVSIGLLALAPPPAPASAAGPVGASHATRLAAVDAPFVIRATALRTIWVDPVNGRDSRTGAQRSTALRTLTAAWRRIPQGTPLTGRGYRILITRGRLTSAMVPNYMESRYGTAAYPIIIKAADGRDSATLPSLNIYDTRHLYLIGLRISSRSGDALHCELCDHLLVRDTTIRGADPDSYRIGDLVKVNQSSSVFIEGSDLSGASDNALDLVAVQYASIRGNRIHDAMDWCAYAKGGSAYVRVDGNEVFDCGVGGFTAGQGTGFQFMTAPWLHYETYDAKIVNNVIHDVWGAGIGVNGGYAVLVAHNTLHKVGRRSHLLEFVAGGRSCDGRPGDDGRGRCAEHLALGGWGTTVVDDGDNFVRIPNRQVLVTRNLIVNRTDVAIGDQHLVVARPFSGDSQNGSGVDVPTRFDDGLVFVDNVIWSSPMDHPLGLGEDTGCTGEGSTCSPSLIAERNIINEVSARLVAPASGDYRLVTPGTFPGDGSSIPDFDWDGAPAGIPQGRLGNAVPRDRDGAARNDDSPPGAYS